MRNLKKFLALVMAMVMAFSLMLTASAANTAKDFDDADSITEAFIEATDVLTGMKVFQGDGDGFYPGRNINRAEVAALIYRLATGDVDDVRAGTYANYGNFTDVSESDWFAGYVGFCANAGYIKGRSATTFDPYASVTGYEALAMILRAIGYDKNGEFTGPTWETNVSALATQLGILTNIKTTHYGNTLYLASRRDVVAELLFQADAKVNMVNYTPAFGYQPYGETGGVTGDTKNPTLGEKIFGLTLSEKGVLLGNQQTGETGSVMGYASDSKEFDAAIVTKFVDGSSLTATWPAGISYSAYTWEQKYDVHTANTIATASGTNSQDATLGTNVKFELETGIDLVGHNLKLWYDNGKGVVSNNKKHVYAYFDQADTTVVKADISTLTANSANTDVELAEAIKDAGFKLNSAKTAVFNDSFGLFGQDAFGSGNAGGYGYSSPVGMYKIIDNDDDKVVDAVIALNIESSKITESNNVNRVPTIGVPVDNRGDGTHNDQTSATGTVYIDDTGNVTTVGTTDTGVIAQAALVGNSTKALGDYEFGIHITGTTPRDPSGAERVAVKSDNTTTTATETAYFLMNKVEATVEGTVVAYNVNAGTVTLDNGTVLERSKYYHTVVGWDGNDTTDADGAPGSVIPQAWMFDGTKWIEGYANVGYKFYTDHEGKYLGAERSYGSTFLYGTYLDYSQEVSSSTFKYFITGVDMNGETKTIQAKKYWVDDNGLKLKDITGTDNLGIPYRDAATDDDSYNGMHTGRYTGLAVTGDIVDSMIQDIGSDKNEYLNNMSRLGIHNGAWKNNATLTAETAFNAPIEIDKDSITLGAEQTTTNSGKYLTEATKFILVSGFGTDSVKAEVYNGISELKGNATSVVLKMDGDEASQNMSGITKNTTMASMTYYTESPYTYAQSGKTDMKIDTIILPKAAVVWAGGSGLFYVGNPTPTLVNSWGTDAWKYDLYQDGELKQVWLTNDPSDNAASKATTRLTKDSFYNLKDTGKKANDGEPIYTAGQFDAANNNLWMPGDVVTANDNPNVALATLANSQYTMTGGATADGVRYSAVTRDAQTATFVNYVDGSGDTAGEAKLYRVAEAKVVNLNKGAKAGGASTLTNVSKCQSGEIWPGITDLASLNEAGSINPVTGRPLKVAAVVDPSNPLVVTCIYVCWDQDWKDIP